MMLILFLFQLLGRSVATLPFCFECSDKGKLMSAMLSKNPGGSFPEQELSLSRSPGKKNHSFSLYFPSTLEILG